MKATTTELFTVASGGRKQLSLLAGLVEFETVYMPARDLASRTRGEYKRDILGLVEFLEGRGTGYWHEVGLPDLQAYLADLDRQKAKPSTRKRKTYSIKAFFSFLAQNGYVSKPHVASELIPPKVPKEERRFLSEDEYNALLAQITSPRDRAIVTMFLQVGLRLEELASLNVYALQLPKRISKSLDDVGMVKVYRKGSNIEYLPLNWKVCQALNVWLKERERLVKRKGLTAETLFLNKYGEPLSGRSIQRMVEKYLKQANIKNASVHSLRHTMATHYLAKGGDIRSVQNMLGHASLETTQIYAGLAKKVQKKMVQDFAL
ncbi:MAG TPA: tyrosine-type recombinase/integrase [Candidatus Dojkabacteria bacterium]|jgi:site-specific recombinase XerD|nr:tyrosine-type recombinase/integrase [Candidatus Dojkabacteria bacterium]